MQKSHVKLTVRDQMRASLHYHKLLYVLNQETLIMTRSSYTEIPVTYLKSGPLQEKTGVCQRQLI